MGDIKLNTLTGIRILPQNQDDKINTSQSQTNDLPPASEKSFGLKTDFALKNGIDSSSFLRFKLENNPAAQNSQAIDNQSEKVFKTAGGEWRKPVNDENAAPEFYRTGENTAGTSLFDERFYQAKGSDKWIELNPNGRLCNLPENKGKQRPENVSRYDWNGWREVSASEVPADYTVEGKQVAFENLSLAENQKSLFKRYIIDNNLVEVWDEVRGERAVDAAIQKGAKLEAVSTGQTNADGKTIFNVKTDEKTLQILRGELRDYKRAVQTDAKTAEKARTEANNLALDIPGAVYETGRNAAEMIINIPQDTGNTVLQNNPDKEIGDQPNFGRAKLGNYDELANVQKTARQNPFPRLDTSGAKYDFRSEAMRRDENGSISNDGQGKGDVTTRVAGAIAPIVIGKAVKAVESPQSLNLRENSNLNSSSINVRKVELNTSKTAKYSETEMLQAYEGEETGSVWGTKVKYLSEAERADLELFVKDGKIVDQKGSLYNTETSNSVFSGGQGRAIFVMDKNGRIYASKFQSVGEFHHSSFLGGKPVSAAGELIIKDGKVVEISNRSGHYQPAQKMNSQVIDELKRRGVDTSNIKVTGF